MTTSAASSPPEPAPIDRPATTLADRGSVRYDAVASARWTVSGAAKVAKDVNVGALGLQGTLSIGGKLSATTLRGRGTLETEGPIEVTGTLALAGTVRAPGPLHAGDLDVNGTLRCERGVTIDRTGSIVGSLETSGLKAGAFLLKGAGRVPGRLEVGTFTAELRESSTLGTLVGRFVQVHGKVPTVVDKALFRDAEFRVDRIEAEAVSLEGVEVAFVRANQIVLGRACHVTEVEGTIVRRHPTSYVGPESRTPPPYGLRR